ncbi:MAG: hypothetical protein JW768_10250 [Chitinispirillaceae bacterium]|nr:hypothetical protein [Chitinispirillaceae bacterium]
MKSTTRMAALLVTVCLYLAAADPTVSIGGYLDADVWGDLTGHYFANSELDLGTTIAFSKSVSAHVYTTVWSANAPYPGKIPAGFALPEQRWLSVLFDGYDITLNSRFGTFAAGDLAYQFGEFNYYFYKRQSMITPESFTRGVRYAAGNDAITQEILFGIADRNGSTADIQGVTGLALGAPGSLQLCYGVRNDARRSFESGTDVYAGAEYLVSFADMLSIKADVGYMNNAGPERSPVVSLLFEPSITFGKWSAAVTGFIMLDNDTAVNSAGLLNIDDEMFFYLEPGYAFSDHVGIGLPLEYHAYDLSNQDDNQVWVVPTCYLYPEEKVQWWLWGQVVYPMVDDAGLGYGIGSEIIVTF